MIHFCSVYNANQWFKITLHDSFYSNNTHSELCEVCFICYFNDIRKNKRIDDERRYTCLYISDCFLSKILYKIFCNYTLLPSGKNRAYDQYWPSIPRMPFCLFSSDTSNLSTMSRQNSVVTLDIWGSGTQRRSRVNTQHHYVVTLPVTTSNAFLSISFLTLTQCNTHKLKHKLTQIQNYSSN